MNTGRKLKARSNTAELKEAAPDRAVNEAALLADLRDLIRAARQRLATVANFGEGFSHSSLTRMVRFVGLEFALYNQINTPAMPLHDAHFGGFFIFRAQK